MIDLVPALTHSITADVPVMDLGITSASAVLFSKALSMQVGIKVPSTFIFDNPTSRSMLKSLTDHISGSTTT
jgi:hypothetical protein